MHISGTKDQKNVSASALNNDRRLEAVDDLHLLDTPPEEAFERIARLVRMIFEVPAALISLVDGHRQWHKACLGLDAGEAERKDTFCRYPVASGEPMVVQDALLDPRVANNPHVTQPGGIRFYAGVPLKTADDQVIGTICAIDYVPRQFSTNDLQILQELSGVVMREIELRQMAGTDPLTGLLSRRSFREQGLRAAKLASRHQHALSCLAIDIDHFKAVNDAHGHAAGDEVLKAVAAACQGAIRETDVFGRLGGEEFAVILPNTNGQGALEVSEKLHSALRGLTVESGNVAIRVTASLGLAALEPYSGDIDQLLEHADRALYAAKNQGRNRTVTWQENASSQRRVLKAGRLFFNDRRSPIDCTIRSLGEQGASIEVWNAVDVPNRFALMIGTARDQRKCQVLARAEKRVEVGFL